MSSPTHSNIEDEYINNILPDDFDTMMHDHSPYKLTRRTNIAYQPDILAELRQEIAQHNMLATSDAPDMPEMPVDLEPIPMVRQTNAAYYLVYSNGLLIDPYGEAITPEQMGTTHANILNIIQNRKAEDSLNELCEPDEYILRYEELLSLPTHENLPMPVLARQTNRPDYWVPAEEEYPELLNLGIAGNQSDPLAAFMSEFDGIL
jgi:hypothetical protein